MSGSILSLEDSLAEGWTLARCGYLPAGLPAGRCLELAERTDVLVSRS